MIIQLTSRLRFPATDDWLCEHDFILLYSSSHREGISTLPRLQTYPLKVQDKGRLWRYPRTLPVARRTRASPIFRLGRVV